MEMRDVTLRMPQAMVEAVRALVATQDVMPGQGVRHAITRELRRRSTPKTPNRADEALVASRQTFLAADIAQAINWPDLDRPLAAHAYRMMAAGSGCALFPNKGRELCKGSELGTS
jgi:hypothetical protein